MSSRIEMMKRFLTSSTKKKGKRTDYCILQSLPLLDSRPSEKASEWKWEEGEKETEREKLLPILIMTTIVVYGGILSPQAVIQIPNCMAYSRKEGNFGELTRILGYSV